MANGTLTVERENGTDVISIDANGKVLFPGNIIPVFRGYVISGAMPNASLVVPTLLKDYDTAGYLTVATAKFLPLVAGYYQINAFAEFSANVSNGYIKIRKNGNANLAGAQGALWSGQASALVFLNGVSDYIEPIMYQSSGGAITANIEFNGSLIRAA